MNVEQKKKKNTPQNRKLHEAVKPEIEIPSIKFKEEIHKLRSKI